MAKPVQAWAALLSSVYVASAVFALDRSLIGTEVWALHYAEGSFIDHIHAVRQDLVHPPLMYLVHRIWISLFGSSDLAVKVLPTVIAIPAIFLFTHLASRVTGHWRVISLLFSCGFVAARVQATTRMYGLVLLLSTAAVLLWDRWRTRPSTFNLVSWAVVMVLLVYTHFFGLLLLAGFGLAALFSERDRRLPFLTATTAVFLSWLPWLLYVLPVYSARGIETNLWWVKMFLSDPLLSMLQIAAGLLGDFHWSGTRSIVLAIVATLLNALLASAALMRIRTSGATHPQPEALPRRWVYPLFVLTLTPVLLLTAYSVMKTPALSGRFVLGIVAVYWLLVGALSDVSGRTGTWLLYGAFLPWVVLSTAQELRLNSRPHPIRTVANEILTALRPDDAVLCAGDCNVFYWEWVHRARQRPIGRLVAASPTNQSSIERQAHEQIERLNVVPTALAETIGSSSRVWVVADSDEAERTASVRFHGLGYRTVGEIHRKGVTALQFQNR